MPICTFCTHQVPYLYTVYESDDNLRLEQCEQPSCRQFADPYVEHDTLTILLDLILLKRGVYRHILFNRGAPPRRLTGKATVEAPVTQGESREWDRWMLLAQLGTTLVFLDSFIRWNYLNPSQNSEIEPWTKETLSSFLRFFLGTAAETIAFHGGITLSCFIITSLINSSTSPKSSIQKEFRLSMIPLSLFYSSLPKLFLLLLLTIWLPSSSETVHSETVLQPWTNPLWSSGNNSIASILEIIDDDKLDREWIVRNILGGMSAGFGLRVILDIHPAFTTFIILIGWAAKNEVATRVSAWVGGDVLAGQAWLAYSIP